MPSTPLCCRSDAPLWRLRHAASINTARWYAGRRRQQRRRRRPARKSLDWMNRLHLLLRYAIIKTEGVASRQGSDGVYGRTVSGVASCARNATCFSPVLTARRHTHRSAAAVSVSNREVSVTFCDVTKCLTGQCVTFFAENYRHVVGCPAAELKTQSVSREVTAARRWRSACSSWLVAEPLS